MESEPVKKFTKCSDCKYLAYDTFWRINGLLVCGDCAEDRKRLEPPSKKRRKKRKEELVKIQQEPSADETRTDEQERNNEPSWLPSGSMFPACVQTTEGFEMEESGSEKPEKQKKEEKMKSEIPEVQEERRPLIVRLKLGTLDDTPSRKSSQQSSSSISSPSRKRSQQSTPPVLSPVATPSPRSTKSPNSSTPDDVPSRKSCRISLRATPEVLSDGSLTPEPPTLDRYPSESSCSTESTSMATDPSPRFTIEAVTNASENLAFHKSTIPTILRRDPATRNNSSSAFPSVFNKDENLYKLYGLCSNPDCKQGLYDKSKNRDKFDDILCYECWRQINNYKRGEHWQRNVESTSPSGQGKDSDGASPNSSEPDFLEVMLPNESPSPSSSSGSSMPSLSPVSSRIRSLEEATQPILENMESPKLKKCSEPVKNIEEVKKSPGILESSGLMNNSELKKFSEHRESFEPTKNSELTKSPEPPKSPDLTQSPEPRKKPQSKRSLKTTRSPQSSEHKKLEKSVERLTKSLEVLKRADFMKSPELEKSPRLPKSPKFSKSPEPTRIPEFTESPGMEISSELTKSTEPTRNPELQKSPEIEKTPELTKSPESTLNPEPTKRNELRKRPEASQENLSPVGSEESEPNPKLKKLLEASVQPINSASIKIGDSEESCASCKRPFLAIHPRRLCHPETHEIVCPSCYRNFEITRKLKIEQLQNPKFLNTMQTNGFPANVPIENFRYGFQPLLYPFPGEPDIPPRRKKKDLVSYFNSSEFRQVLEKFQKETEKRIKEDNEPRKGECRDLVEDGRPRCNNHFCRVLLNGSGFAHPVTRNVVCPPCYKYFKKRRSDRKEKPAYNEQICEENFRTWRHPTTNEKCCYMCFKNVMWHLGNYIKKSSSPGAPSQKPQKTQKQQTPVMKSPIGAARPLFSTGRLLPFNNPNWRFTFPDFFKPYPTVQNLLMYLQKNGKFFISSNYGAPVMDKGFGQIGRPKSPPEIIVLDDDSDSEATIKKGPMRQEKIKKSLSFRIADLIDLKDTTVEKPEVPTVKPVSPPRTNQRKICFTPNCNTVLTPSRQFYLHGTKNWICCACYRAYLENELKKVAEVERMEKEQNLTKNDNEDDFIDVEAVDDPNMDSPMPCCSDTVSPELLEKDGEDDNESIEDFSDEDSDLLESMDNVRDNDNSASEGVAEGSSGDSGLIGAAVADEMDTGALEPTVETKRENQREADEMKPHDPDAEDRLEKIDSALIEITRENHYNPDKLGENLGVMETNVEDCERNSDGATLNGGSSENQEPAIEEIMESTKNGETNHKESIKTPPGTDRKMPDCAQGPIVDTSAKNFQKGQTPIVDDRSFEETEDFSDDDLDWLDSDSTEEGHDGPDKLLKEASQNQVQGSSPTEALFTESIDKIHDENTVKNQSDQESMPGTPCSNFSDEDLDWMGYNDEDQDDLDEILLEAENHDAAPPPSKEPSPDEKPHFGDLDETGSQCSEDSIPVIEDFSFSDFDDEDPEDFINNYHDPMDVPDSQDARISANEAAFENAMEAEYDEYGDRNPLSPVFANNKAPLGNEGKEDEDGPLESEDSSSSSDSSSDDDEDSSSSKDSDYKPWK